jgi:hypothetical protein
MRPKEPDDLKVWRQSISAATPKYCHTCDFYSKDGHCKKFDADPPEGFVNTLNACQSWEDGEIPF